MINEALTFETVAEYNVSFVSNGEQYNKITIFVADEMSGEKGVLYDSTVAAHIYSNTLTAWENSAYRTITLEQPATGDLLTWLQANAVKQ